jgi:lipid II:glycine glycyltransferase (peptidoglycan interpeptide bridge formation enzyme)
MLIKNKKDLLKSNFSLDKDDAFAIRIASLFDETFTNYEAFFLTTQNKVIAPIVRINSKTKIYQSLPYSWHSFLRITDEELDLFPTILSIMKPDILSFSFHSIPSYESIKALKKAGFKEDKYLSHFLQLNSDFDSIFSTKFSTKNRNQCRKALKSNLNFIVTKELKYIEEYFGLYKKATESWEKHYVPYPLEFIKKLILENENVDFWVTIYENKVVGGLIIVKYDFKIYYWASAIDREYSMLCPINGLLYSALKEYSLKGFSVFDFGPNPQNEGVAHFKKSYGTSEHFYYNYTFYSWRYKYLIQPILKILKR